MKNDITSIALVSSLQFLAKVWPEFPLLPMKFEEITSNVVCQRMLQEDPLRVKGGIRVKTLVEIINGLNVSG